MNINPKREIPNIGLQGGWSYCDQQIQDCVSYLNDSSGIKVLELGSGDSTIKLYNFLRTKYDEVIFHTFDTNQSYLCKDPRVIPHLYADVQSCDLPIEVFDLILVDGPNGETRKLWYSKLKDCCRVGSIIHIDDDCHYASFMEEVNTNFEYELLDNVSMGHGGLTCWKTIKVTKIR
jgi:hypothetical protein